MRYCFFRRTIKEKRFGDKQQCVECAAIFFIRKISFSTELIFAEKTLEIFYFEPNGMFKILMKSDLHLSCFSTSEVKVGVRSLQQNNLLTF